MQTLTTFHHQVVVHEVDRRNDEESLGVAGAAAPTIATNKATNRDASAAGIIQNAMVKVHRKRFPATVN